MTQSATDLLQSFALNDEALEAILPILTKHAIAAAEKVADPATVASAAKEKLLSPEFAAKYAPSINAHFSEEELLFLVSFYRSAITKKFNQKSQAIFSPLYGDYNTTVQEVLSTYPSIEKAPVSDHVIPITSANHESEVLNSSLPLILDGYAAWCPPCKMLEPILSELSHELLGKVKFVKLNVDNEQALGAHYQIQAMPTLLFIQNGKVLHRHVGLLDKPGFLTCIIQHFLRTQ